MPWPLPHAVQCSGDHSDGSIRNGCKEGKQLERSTKTKMSCAAET